MSHHITYFRRPRPAFVTPVITSPNPATATPPQHSAHTTRQHDSPPLPNSTPQALISSQSCSQNTNPQIPSPARTDISPTTRSQTVTTNSEYVGTRTCASATITSSQASVQRMNTSRRSRDCRTGGLTLTLWRGVRDWMTECQERITVRVESIESSLIDALIVVLLRRWHPLGLLSGASRLVVHRDLAGVSCWVCGCLGEVSKGGWR